MNAQVLRSRTCPSIRARLYPRFRARATVGLAATLMGVSVVAHADIGTVTTLHSFSGPPDGAYPISGLLPAGDGTYIGTTSMGGSQVPAGGTVFRIAPDGSESILYSFPGNPPDSGWGSNDGAYPSTGVINGPAGIYYGTTPAGGPNLSGTFFGIDSSGNEALIMPFSNGADGGVPTSPLVTGDDGRYYAISAGDNQNSMVGSYAYGLVLSVSPPGTPFSGVLHVFSGGDDGGYPQTLIKGSDGNFYGTTEQGGANGSGSIFRITPTGSLTTIHSFASRGSPSMEGAAPEALIQAGDGNFYGTTLLDGAQGNGTVFKLTPTGELTTLYSFKGSPDGAAPASLIMGSDGNLYGTTRGGGLSWAGTVFELRPDGQEFTLYSLHGTPDSWQFLPPWLGVFDMLYESAQAPLLEVGKGTFLATGYLEGAYGQGSVYQLVVSPADPAPEARIGPSISTVYPNDPLSLYWSSIGTSACTAGGDWSGSEPTTGTQSIIAPATPGVYTYTLSCNTESGTASASTTVTVQTPPAPYISFPLGTPFTYEGGSEFLSVARGTTLLLSWSTAYAASCAASGDWSGPVATAGSQNVDISKLGEKTYTLSCSGPGGTSNTSLIVQVAAQAPVITSFIVSPSTISLGSAARMQWMTNGARTCSIDLYGTHKSVRVNGNTYIKPTARGVYRYALNCSNGTLGASASATLTVQ